MKFLTTWRFDSLSFWIGFILAALLALVLYRLHTRITAFREAMGESYRTAVEALTTTSAQGYHNDLMRWAQSSHIVPHLFALEEILLPPRVLAAPPPLDPAQPPEYDAPALFPFAPDWPQLAESYGANGIPVPQLLLAQAELLLSGLPGSGKTTILAALTSGLAAPVGGTRTAGRGNSQITVLRQRSRSGAPELHQGCAGSARAGRPTLRLHAFRIADPALLKDSLKSEGGLLLLDAVDELAFPAQDEVREWVRSSWRNTRKRG